jgi:hypothetical protein
VTFWIMKPDTVKLLYIQHKDTQHNNTKSDTQHNDTQNNGTLYRYAECHSW